MDSLVVFLADILIVPIVLIAAYMILRLPASKRWPSIARGVVVALTALWLAKIGSLFYQGTRPFIEMGVDPKASYLANPGFPSDHALLVFTAAFVVWAATGHRKIAAVLFFMAVLVALGRVLALVHSPADVIGSFIFAFVSALLWYGLALREKYQA